MTVFTVGIVVIASIIHLIARRKTLDGARAVAILSLYAFGIFIGFSGLFAAFGHIVAGPEIAAQIGWEPGNPFQTEVGICNAAFGILGLLAIRCKGGFRLATALGWSIFLIGASILHIQEMLTAGNFAAYNVGMIAPDILIPVYLLILVGLERHFDRKTDTVFVKNSIDKA